MFRAFQHAICNEVYERRPFVETCKAIRAAGYDGIEIAPFTLAEDPAAIPPAARREYRDVMKSEGLRFVGFHWLLVSPKGLHVTTPDSATCERSWAYLRDLTDLCGDLGGGVMVFGSPKQRSSTGGMVVADATKRLANGLFHLADQAVERRVTILLEALPPADTDVVTSLDEAACIVRQIGSHGVKTMFDVHNSVSEREAHDVLVERYFDVIRHVHLNEMDGRHPGTGTYDYKPVLRVLARRTYTGWLSLEVFDFSAGADRIATESLKFIQSEVAKIA